MGVGVGKNTVLVRNNIQSVDDPIQNISSYSKYQCLSKMSVSTLNGSSYSKYQGLLQSVGWDYKPRSRLHMTLAVGGTLNPNETNKQNISSYSKCQFLFKISVSIRNINNLNSSHSYNDVFWFMDKLRSSW